MDIGAINTIISSIKTATDLAKFINESGISLEKAEVKLKLAELISALAEAKMEVAAVQQIILDKDIEIGKLREQMKIKEKIKWEKPYYWLEDEGKKDGPFCQQCYDNEQKLIRLTDYGDGSWVCKTCSSSYFDKNFKSQVDIDNNYDPLDHGL